MLYFTIRKHQTDIEATKWLQICAFAWVHCMWKNIEVLIQNWLLLVNLLALSLVCYDTWTLMPAVTSVLHWYGTENSSVMVPDFTFRGSCDSKWKKIANEKGKRRKRGSEFEIRMGDAKISIIITILIIYMHYASILRRYMTLLINLRFVKKKKSLISQPSLRSKNILWHQDNYRYQQKRKLSSYYNF